MLGRRQCWFADNVKNEILFGCKWIEVGGRIVGILPLMATVPHCFL